MWRKAGWLFPLCSILIVASCRRDDSGPPPGGPPPGGPPPPSWVQQQASGCGMYLFQTPACEAALDQGCCAHQIECANDPACRAIAQCFNYCESQAQGRACESCLGNCATLSTPRDSAARFMMVANCSKNIRYPDNISCSGSC